MFECYSQGFQRMCKTRTVAHAVPRNGIQIRNPSYSFLFLQVIAAEGEQKASRALKEAADVIQESPSALQVT